MCVDYGASVIDVSKKFVSLETSCYMYEGGAHPLTTFSYNTINRKTGKQVSLKKFAKCSISSFNKKVISILNKKFPAEYSVLDTDYKKILKKRKFKDYNFYYKKGELHIVFTTYEISSYAVGTIDIVVK